MKTRNLIAIILILSFVISPSFKVYGDNISEIEQNEKALLDVKVDSLISNIINTIDQYYVDPSLGKKIIAVRIPNTKGGLPAFLKSWGINEVKWNSREINNALS